MLDVLQSNAYLIDQKISKYLNINGYQIYNLDGVHIGSVYSQKNTLEKLLKFLEIFDFLPIKPSNFLPFTLFIIDVNGNILAKISRGFTLSFSNIKIHDKSGYELGSIRQLKWKFFKYVFEVTDSNKSVIANLSSNFRAKNFSVTNSNNQLFGTINKKWKGVLKEIFTNAKKYQIAFDDSYQNLDNKLLIIAAAISIDVVLKKMK